MFSYKCKYTNYNDEEVVEKLYFGFTEAELAEMKMSENGAFAERLRRLINTKDITALAKQMKEIILDAYGEKSTDGKRFMKSPEIRHNFECSLAFSEVYMKMFKEGGEEFAQQFINGVLPESIKAELAANKLDLMEDDID